MPHYFRPGCTVLMLASALCHSATYAQAAPPPALNNVLKLSAKASTDVPQDLLSITLGTNKQGANAAVVQSQLRQALDAALQEARKAARPALLEVRTGEFSVEPRYASNAYKSDDAIVGWQGRAELLIEGSDLTAISQLAGRLTTLTVGRIGFSLSRQARERAQADVAAQAIGRFKAQADAYAKQFGFDSYSLREVEVSGGDEGGWRQPYQIAAARAPGSEAQPVEAGKEQVRVTVSGSVQLLPR